MTDFTNLERDGKIAVLYSRGFGAGWYSWNRKHRGLLFDSEIASLVLADKVSDAVALAEKKYPGIYAGGGSALAVEWVPKGSRFEIDEYDGSETVRVFGPDDGHVA